MGNGVNLKFLLQNILIFILLQQAYIMVRRHLKDSKPTWVKMER